MSLAFLEQLRSRVSARPWLLAALSLAGLAGTGFLLWRRLRWLPSEEQALEMDTPLTQAQVEPVSALAAEREGGGRPLQLSETGAGPLYHRRYRVDIANVLKDPAELMAHVKAHLPDYFPPLFIRVEKTLGETGELSYGDEYYLHMVGPWDAPIRVVDETPTSFTFITLAGHVEAGQIRFRFVEHPERDDLLRFEIISWARSQDRVVNLGYTSLPLLKYPQTQLWTYFCSRVVDKSGGQAAGKIRILTQKAPFKGEVVPDRDQPVWKRYRSRLEELQDRGINFDPEQRHTYSKESGWNVDRYCAPLPDEKPGEPVENGSWERAREIVYNYEFPDPDLITGIYVPDTPLEDRVILLRARFLGLTFYFGTRVGDVIDETRTVEGRGQARVWGYSYRTLERHIEKGEMTFTVWKFLETGEVEFHIDAYSRGANIGNPFYRLGWFIFGRPLQRRYAKRAQDRMQEMVVRRLQGEAPATRTPEVRKTHEDEKVAAKVEELEEQS